MPLVSSLHQLFNYSPSRFASFALLSRHGNEVKPCSAKMIKTPSSTASQWVKVSIYYPSPLMIPKPKSSQQQLRHQSMQWPKPPSKCLWWGTSNLTPTVSMRRVNYRETVLVHSERN